MKAYNKYEVDEIFSSWQSDLEQLSVLEVYTKSDIVAMFTELQLEIEEVKTQSGFDEAWDGAVGICVTIIQEKINSLKEDTDGDKW